MKELRTEIDIQVPAERVWQILLDFDSYPQWNPFIRRISGRPAVGETLEVRLQPTGGSGITLRPRVVRVEPDREFRWRGRLFFSGLLDAEHIFALEPLAADRVRFVQREEFNGLLVPLVARRLDTETRRGFEEMNQALKVRAESE